MHAPKRSFNLERVSTSTHGARGCLVCASACAWSASSLKREPLLRVLAQFQAAHKSVDKGEGRGGREASGVGERDAGEEFVAKVAVLGNVERC